MAELKTILERISYNIEILSKEKKSLDAFKEKKKEYHTGLLRTNISLLQRMLQEPELKDINNIGQLQDLADSLDGDDFTAVSASIRKMEALIPDIKPPKRTEIDFRIPPEIKDDILADIGEIDKCFKSECYRSVAILCGRLLEVALHRKYYEATAVDLLEKSPGIGLGKIIAKLSEKKIELDPGLSQQIHLINQVRVFSVHIKQTAFNPNKNQAQAMMLYTMDILEKIFK